MTQRSVAMVLAAVLSGTVQHTSLCARGDCGLTSVRECCQHGGGLARPCCCPPIQRIGARATSGAADRLADGLMHAAAGPLIPFANAPSAPVLATAWSASRCAAPPGTLFSQRTSLVI
jgi:hypothetical protein